MTRGKTYWRAIGWRDLFAEGPTLVDYLGGLHA